MSRTLINSRKYRIAISDQQVRDDFKGLPRKVRRSLVSACNKVKKNSAFKLKENTCLISRIKTSSGLKIFGIIVRNAAAVVFLLHRSILTILSVLGYSHRERILVEESIESKNGIVEIQVTALSDKIIWIITYLDKPKGYLVPLESNIPISHI